MKANFFEEISKQTLKGEINFGEVVAKMINEGVESYRVDFVRKEKTYYMPNGENCVVALAYDDHALAKQFNADGIQAAIKASQRGEIKFPQFIPRALDAGVANYVVYFQGRKVIYFGRNGEMHIELFP